jgi:hypothetical protein
MTTLKSALHALKAQRQPLNVADTAPGTNGELNDGNDGSGGGGGGGEADAVDDIVLATRLVPRVVNEALRSNSAALIGDGAALRWRGTVLIATLVTPHEPSTTFEQSAHTRSALPNWLPPF